MPCSPQRYFANHRNLIRDAVLTPSNVQAVSNAVREVQLARVGTAALKLSGPYSGLDDATYDFEIVDDSADTKLMSTPIFSGSGSETLIDLAITTAAQQKFTLECAVPGKEALAARVEVEGVSIVARGVGAGSGSTTAYQFRDTYSGIAESFATHAPEVGSAYIGGTPADDNAVNGTGGWPSQTGSTGDVQSNLAADPGGTYKLRQSLTVTALGADALELDLSVTDVELYSTWDGANFVTELYVGADDSGPIDVTSNLGVGAHVIEITVSPSGVVAKIDGAVVATSATVPATATHLKVENHTTGGTSSVTIDETSVSTTASGGGGNSIHITVDEDGLAYAATAFSLLTDMKKGDGSAEAPLVGSEYDWQTATVGADDVIPLTAKRLVFDGDESNVYVQFKRFVDGDYQYFLVPAAKEDYPAGTKIKFVTGSRVVTITDGTTTDTLPGIVTVFDFLSAVKTTSILCDVDGIVADDRTSTGQSARELNLHTIARHGYSYGTGSKVAKGFTDVIVDDDANTELVTAECIGVSFKDSPLAWVGHEAWKLAGSVSGELGTIYTGIPFLGDTFGLKIPVRLPLTIDQPAGKITKIDAVYATRDEDETEPDICFKGVLGPNAVDQTLTLTYKPRPTGDCRCDNMPFPSFAGPCLGTVGEGDDTVGYQDDTIARLSAMREWYSDTARSRTVLPGDGVDPSTQDFALTNASGAAAPAIVVGHPIENESLKALIDDFERVAALMDPLEIGSPSLRSSGFLVWDDALSELQGDVDGLGFPIYGLPTERYKARLGWALSAAGLSPLGKADASILTSGDGCWQDYGDAFWWEIVGSENGLYAPAFTNQKYYSSHDADGNKKYYSTHEFAFQINVACPEDLKEGDVITVVIGNAPASGTYQVGDMLFLPLIAKQDLYLTGGREADKVQTWYLTGDVDGAFPPYTFDPDAPVAYDDANGLTFLLVMGGIMPSQGDRFAFSAEGGHYRFRKNGGSWSSDLPIESGVQAFEDGLSIEFVRGVNPSFVAADAFSFKVRQQWRASNLQRPSRDLWFPGVAAPTMKALFASIQPITAFALAYHTIPQGATIVVKGGDVEDVVDWTEPITWNAGPIAQMTSMPRTAIWCRLEITTGAASSAGWWFAGVPDATGLSSDATPKLSYKIDRGNGSGLYQGGTYLAKARSVDIEWTNLFEADVVVLTELVDHVKSNNDEPIIFMPNETRPDAMLAQIVDDEIPLPDLFGLQPNADRERMQSAHLTLQGVWA